MKINPGNARGLLVPQGDRPFSFVVYSSEIRDFGPKIPPPIPLSPNYQMSIINKLKQNFFKSFFGSRKHPAKIRYIFGRIENRDRGWIFDGIRNTNPIDEVLDE